MQTTSIDLKDTIKSALEDAVDYNTYRTKIATLVSNYTPSPQLKEPDLEYYTKLNHQRMTRIEKKLVLLDEVKEKLINLKTRQLWLVISEGWCGDAAQSLPVINAMAAQNSLIDLKIVYRDQNLELMDQFLTNGGRSIPKLIILDPEEYEVINTWGPRPADAQKLYMALKNNGEPFSEIISQLQKWYAVSKAVFIQKEIVELI